MALIYSHIFEQKVGLHHVHYCKSVIILGEPLILQKLHETVWENENSFILKANNGDITRGFLINIHDVGHLLKFSPTNTAF